MKKYLIALALLLLPSFGWSACTWDGNTGLAADVTVAGIQSCISDASTKTGAVVINLPPGTETWTTNLSVNMASGFTNVTSLSLIGAGTPNARSAASSGGSTINLSGAYINIVGHLAKQFRISNITWTGTAGGNGAMYITGKSKPASTACPTCTGGWRIDHHTNTQNNRLVAISDYTYGVIDSNTSSRAGMFLYVDELVSFATENDGWGRANSFGTADAVYMENNDATNTDTAIRFFTDGVSGARIVMRYNNMTDYYVGHHDASSVYRGVMQDELYNNKIIVTTRTDRPFMKLRGGTGVFYNNALEHWKSTSNEAFSVSALRPHGVLLENYRSVACGLTTLGLWANKCDASGSALKGFLAAGSTYSASTCTSGTGCEYIDDLSGDGKGYPCRDQIGRGYNQTHLPQLWWDNTVKFGANDPVALEIAVLSCAATDIADDRDFCYASTCSGDDCTYTCGGTEVVYEAYTCPHPLTGYSGTCGTGAGVSAYNETGADETPPTVTSFYIYSGTTVINFSELITATSGAAFTVAGLGSAMTLTCPAVETAASSMTCTNSRTVYQAEGNGTYGYTGTKVIDAAENQLATIDSSPTAVNLSTEVEEPPAVTLTVNKTGSGCTITSSPSGIIAGTTTTADYDTGTVVTLGGYVENGWNSTIVYGGDCASNGTVTMSSAKTCTATCTEKKVLNWSR